MPASEATQAVMARLKQGRVIGIISAPAPRLRDIRSLVLLSQVLYWTTRDKSVLRAEGWLSKPAGEWMAETGLTRSYLASAVSTLREHGVLKVWSKAKLAPWWKVDLQGLHALCHGAPAVSALSLARFCSETAYRDRIVGKSLPYYTILSEAVGDALAGFFLSRCVYWQELLEQRNRIAGVTPWGWSSTDWTADIGITRSQLRTVMKQLVHRRLIVVTEIGRPFPGVFVDMERLCEVVKANYVPQNSTREECREEQGLELGTSFKSAEEKSSCTPWTPQGGHLSTPFKSAEVWSIYTPWTTGVPLPENEEFSHTAPELFAGNDQLLAESQQARAGFSPETDGFDQPFAGFSQSTRAYGIDYSDYPETTTTTPSTIVDTSTKGGTPAADVVVVQRQQAAEPDLIYPVGLLDADIEAMATHLEAARPHRRQALLDEIAGRMAALPSTVRTPPGYLRSLVGRDNAAGGRLALDYAGAVRQKRQRQAAIAASQATAAQVTPAASTPSTLSERPPPGRYDFDELKAILAGKAVLTADPRQRKQEEQTT